MKQRPNPAAKAARPAPKRPCPTCGKDVDWSLQPDYRPFCSKRCHLIDLGEWASDRYRIASNQLGNDLGDGPGGDPDAGAAGNDYPGSDYQ